MESPLLVKRMKKTLLTFALCLWAISLWAQTLAFPTAEGFGKYASGGRGGKVVEVTTLADSGEGSLRWALTEAGRALREKAKDVPAKVAGCIDLPPEKAQMLYALLYELLDKQKNKPLKGE